MALVAAVLLVVSAGLIFWRLSQGPISLSRLVPRVEESLTQLVEPNTVTCAEIVIAKRGRLHSLNFQVTDVALTGPKNNEIARFKELDVDLDFFALMRGKVRPKAISLSGLHLAASRDINGKLSFALGGPKTSETDTTIEPTVWLARWLDPDEHGPLRRLERIEIIDASLEVNDLKIDQIWGADDLRIAVQRTRSGFKTSLDMTTAINSKKIPFSATAAYSRDNQALEAHLKIAGLNLSDLAFFSPSLAPLTGIDLVADASIDVAVDKEWAINIPAFEFKTPAGTITGAVDLSDPKRKISGNLEITELRPSVVGADVPQLEALKDFGIVVGGRADFALTNLEQLEITKLKLNISGQDRAKVDLGGLSADELNINFKNGGISGQLVVDNLNPHQLAQHIKLLKPVAGLRFPIKATLTADILGWQSGTIDFGLRVGSGHVDLPDPVAQTTSLSGATLAGRLTDLQALTVSQGMIDLGGDTKIDFSSTIRFSDPMPAITAEADIAALSIERLQELWPPNVAEGARTWVSNHILDGAVSNVHAKAEIGDTRGRLGLRSLTGQFTFSDLQLVVFPGISAITGINGTASISKAQLGFDLTDAHLGDLTVTGGSVVISGLDKGPTVLRIATSVDGPVPDALALVNDKPLALVDPKFINAKEVSGTSTTLVSLSLPLGGPDSGTISTFDITSKITDFTWSTPPIGPATSEGEFSLHVTPTGVDLKGTSNVGLAPISIVFNEYFSGTDLLRKIDVRGTLNREAWQSLGVPELDFLSGTLGVDVNFTTDRQNTSKIVGEIDLRQAEITIPEIAWHKPSGSPGQLSVSGVTKATDEWIFDPIALTANDFSAGARLEIKDKPLSVTAVDLIEFKHGRNDLKFRVKAGENDRFEIQVRGSAFDIEPVVSSWHHHPAGVENSSKKRPEIPAFDLDIDLDGILGRDDVKLSNLTASISFDGTTVNIGTVSAKIGDSGHLSISTSLAKDLRTANAEVDGLGAVMSMFHLAEYFDGGTMTLNGNEAADGQLSGPLEMRDLKFNEAPIFAQLLRAASMEGLLSTIKGQGLSIKLLKSELVFKDSILKINNLIIHADGVGVTADGTIDFASKSLDTQGFLTPAATIQRVIGKIPLLGQILTGVKREGFIATEFSMTGPLTEPIIKAKPLSTLTPGLTRDLFRFKNSGNDDTPSVQD